MKSMEDSDNCNYKVFIQFAWTLFIFPQTISHQFLIADKLYSQITGNMSCLIQMAIAKIPYTSKHRTILIWSFVAALKCTRDLIFCRNMTTTQTTKLVLPFTGMYLWTFVFNYSIKIWKWYCCSDLLLGNQFSKYITCICLIVYRTVCES